ncbi:MAG: sulfatase-like hydrolase/transferase, partial [Vicinamibacterales bacterium]
YEHGVRDNSGYRVPDGTVTLATRLKAAGFATGAFVGGFPLTKRFGLTPGFDVYDDQVPELKGDVSFSMPERRAEDVVSRAVAWIDAQQGRFFSWVHVFDPHAPYAPPEPYLSEYTSQPYDGEIAYVDHALGALFDALATRSRPTVVIVTADHGESLGDHGELTHGMFAYEATLHVPLIVATVHPGQAARTRGVVVDSPVRHIDIAPTVLDAMALPADQTLPGASLRDAIRTGNGGDRPMYFEAMTYNLVRGWAPLRGVLVGRDKFIDLPIRELYDLAADPEETRNLAPEQSGDVQVMANVLRGYNTAPPGRPSQENARTAELLRSLGYITGSAPAREAYTEADDPKRLVDVDRDLHEATGFYQRGQVQEALAMFRKVIEARPDMADAYIQLASAYWELGEIQPAIATIEQGLAKGAPDRDLRIRLGYYLAETGQAEQALKLLEGLPDTDAEALNSRGVAYTRAGRFPEAVRTFRQILDLDRTNGLAWQNIASTTLEEAKATKDADARRRLTVEAEGYARQALDVDPSLPVGHVTLGAILNDLGRKAEAIDEFTRAVDLDKDQFDALYNLTVMLAEAGRVDEARAYARQFVDRAPEALYARELQQFRGFLGR